MGRVIALIGRFIGYLVLLLLALAVLGAYVPSIPVLGSVGPLLIGAVGSWMVVLSLVCAVTAAVRWRRRGGRLVMVMALLASFAGVGTAVIQAQQISAARSHGVAIDIARTFWLGSVSHVGAAPTLARYGSHEGHPLNLLVYRPPARPGRAAPVLVYVHGGGWGGGTLDDHAADMRWYADRGYLTFSVDYTLSSPERPTWDVSEPQVGCALNWIAAHAASLGGDPARLALIGESAGGNLVVIVAYKIGLGTFRPACPGMLPRIAAVVAPYPVLDAVRMYRNPDVVAGPFGRQMTTQYTGGPPTQFAARYVAISSPTHIHAGAPPTLILPGMADHLLPPQIAAAFVARAGAAGVPIRSIAIPYGEHSFDQVSGSIGNQMVRGATLQFLADRKLAP